MKRLSAQMSDKDRADRLAARCASQMDKIAEQDKRIKELGGLLDTVLKRMEWDYTEGPCADQSIGAALPPEIYLARAALKGE